MEDKKAENQSLGNTPTTSWTDRPGGNRATAVENALQDQTLTDRAMRLIGTAPCFLFECDNQGRLLFASESWYAYTGLMPEETAQLEWLRALHPDDIEAVAARWSKALTQGCLFCSRHRLRALDGSFRWFLARSTPVRGAGGDIVRWTGVLTDIEDLVLAEEALCVKEKELLRANSHLAQSLRDRTAQLNKLTRELKELTKTTIEAIENDRKALSKDLHDSIGGTLAAIRYRLEGRIEAMQAPPPGIGITFERINDHLLSAIKETRRLSKQLRPFLLDDFGLVPAIVEFLLDFKELHAEIDILEHLSFPEETLGENAKTILYRVVQEAMNNVGKHSRARTVVIRLEQLDTEARLYIEDDGQGFDLKTALTQTKALNGYGIRGMQERIEMCKGTFRIHSSPARGTRIDVRVPLQGSQI